MAKVSNYIFVDESGDPGKPLEVDSVGNKIPTGSSLFYIISAVCLDEKKIFSLEHRIMEEKTRFGYMKEIKSDDVSLSLYKALLGILNELNIKTYYRLIDKISYRGVFAVDGKPKLHNVFDEYNLVKTVTHAIMDCNMKEVEVIIDRTDRRLLNGKFDSFNDYLSKKVNKKTIKRIEHVTHANSVYINIMQISDLISGAIRDQFNKRNTDLVKVINSDLLVRVL
ncbi:MAG: DUF3800 domain-containing protein [Patescibacteria group bacterium]